MSSRRPRSLTTPEAISALYIVFLARRDDLLALESRRTVYQFLERYPGLHLREVARGTGMDPNHVKYHLQSLEKNGLVSSRKEDGYWRFWPTESSSVGKREVLSPKDKKVVALLRREVPLHVTLLLLEQGEAKVKDLVEKVGVSQSTLSYHLRKMEKDGLVEARKEGRERHYRLIEHDRIQGLLLQYKPPDSLVKGFLEAWEQLEL